MSTRVKLFIPIVVFLVMAGLLWMGLGRDPNMVPSALLDRPVPEFSLPSLHDPAETFTDEDLAGGIHIVNFWATWCPPCHAEHPYLMEISAREKDLSFVGVNYKNPERGGDEAREFLAERGDPYEFTMVDIQGRLGIDMGLTAAPETYIIDAAGTIRYRHVGPVDNRIWAQTFEPILARIRAEQGN